MEMVSRKYVGPRKSLQGKTALLKDVGEEDCWAQFDDVTFQEAFGWWKFKNSDFEIIPSTFAPSAALPT